MCNVPSIYQVYLLLWIYSWPVVCLLHVTLGYTSFVTLMWKGPAQVSYCPCLLDESFLSEHGKVFCWLSKLSFPPFLLSAWLKTKSTRVQYFHNFWNLLCGEERGERVDAEQPQPAGLCLSIYALELLSLCGPERARAAVQAVPCRRSVPSALSGRHESRWGQDERVPEDCWGHRLFGKQAATSVLTFLCFYIQRLEIQRILNFLIL